MAADPVTAFRLEHFEWLVTTDDRDGAVAHLAFLLAELDRHYGGWGPAFIAHVPALPPPDLLRHLCTRVVSAVTTLLSKPSFVLAPVEYRQLMGCHRWLALIFAVSPFRNADHIIRSRNEAGGGVVDALTIGPQTMRLFCLCYFLDSDVPLDLEALWRFDRDTLVVLCFALLSARAVPTATGHRRKEELLAWLPGRMDAVSTLDALPLAVLQDVVMHCSYADQPAKHAIKRDINRLIAQALAASPVARLLPIAPPPERTKPLVAVMLEWFGSTHAIYRTHASTIRALRGRFRVVGFGLPGTTDAISQDVFDDFIGLPGADVATVVAALAELRPDLLYYPSIGMFRLTAYLANLRLAPLQLMGLGHPATTHSPEIDGVLVEEDFVGDPACFSEPLIALPPGAMPVLPPAETERVAPRAATEPAAGEPIRVAICASVMKLNPGFLETLAAIGQWTRRPVRFCFHLAMATGLSAAYAGDAIRAVLPDAEVNPHLPIPDYLANLNRCDLFLSPYPFGNTNGLVDAVRLGLPGVCLTGPEVHSHIDEGLFRRLRLPESLIATNPGDYIREALRLIEDDSWRLGLRRQLLERELDLALFAGNPAPFVDAVARVYRLRLNAAATST